MYTELTSENRPDDLLPCRCNEESILCPNNINILSSPAAQLHLQNKFLNSSSVYENLMNLKNIRITRFLLAVLAYLHKFLCTTLRPQLVL